MSEQIDQVRFRLKELRKENGLTLEDIAKIIGVQKAAYCKLEQGQRKTIKMEYIRKLADFYNVNPAWICGYDTNKYIVNRNVIITDILKLLDGLSEKELKKIYNLIKGILE